MLCSQCIKVLQEQASILSYSSLSELRSIDHSRTWHELEAKASEGCTVCYAIREAFLQLPFSRSGLRSHAIKLYSERQKDKAINTAIFNRIFFAFQPRTPVWYSPLIAFFEKPKRLESRLSRRSNHSMNTGSAESLACIKNWVERCNADHRCFDNQKLPTQYPARLLEICDHASTVRVVACNESELSEHYIALSHCWGKNMPLKLDKGSKEMLQKGIPTSSLPKTFRDAVFVCCTLDVRYLWIDSLCIEQGPDSLEWKHESVRMNQIYGNAYLTIVASAASDSSGGLFQDRLASWIDRITGPFDQTIVASAASDSSGGLFQDRLASWIDRITGPFDQSTKLWELIDINLWIREVENSPLAGRAWAFQERLLSPRTLYFGKSQALWQCCELVACETYPDSMHHKVELPYLLKTKALPATDYTLQKDRSLSRKTWNDIVVYYSQARLTVESDKLVALSGVAREWATSRDDKYVCGMWEDNILSDLLWRAVRPGRRPSVYVAPSFSWASLDADIQPLSNHRVLGEDIFKSFAADMAIEDLHVQTEPEVPAGKSIRVGDDDQSASFGAVIGGHVRVRAELKTCRLVRQSVGFGFDIGVNSRYALIYLDSESDTLADTIDLHYLLAATTKFRSYYLLLRHLKEGQYQRVGIVHVIVDRGRRQSNKVLQARRTDAYSLPCEKFDQETHEHIFTII